MINTNWLSTPLWGELDDVYEPSEDTFLLLDALEIDRESWCSSVGNGNWSPAVVVEVGSGSGVVVTAAATLLSTNAHCIAVDINCKACSATAATATTNSALVDVICSDLCEPLSVRNIVDMLIFNPPYVVTPPEEISGTLTRSWAGGIKGRQILDRLMDQLPQLMSPRCVGYIVAIDENIPEEICNKLSSLGFMTEIILKRKVPGENLSVIRFSRFAL